MKRLFYFASVLLYVLVAVPAHGDQPFMGPRLRRMLVQAEPQPAPPTPSPAPSPTTVMVELPEPNLDPPTVSVTVGAMATMTGGIDTAITPEAFIEVEAPLAVGKGKSLGRFYARLGITSSPGQSVDLASPQTFKSAEVGFGVGRVVGYWGDDAFLRTLIVAEAGFSTRLPNDPEPRDRVLHYFGFGLRFADRDGNSITALLGQDQVSNAALPVLNADGTMPGQGAQAILYGAVRVPGTKGIVRIIGDATVNVILPSDPLIKKRDVVRIGAEIDGGQVVSLLTGHGNP